MVLRTCYSLLFLLVINLHGTAVFSQQPLIVKSATFSECSSSPMGPTPLLKNRISDIQIERNTMTFGLVFSALCCVRFEVGAILHTTDHGDSLAIVLGSHGAECECECFYEGKIVFERITRLPGLFSLDGTSIALSDERYVTFPVRYSLYKGDTIGTINMYGVTDGKWAIGKDRFREYKDNAVIRDIAYYTNGRTMSIIEHLPVMYNHYIEYDEAGQKRKECYSGPASGSFKDKGSRCIEWDTAGKVIYEGEYRKN